MTGRMDRPGLSPDAHVLDEVTASDLAGRLATMNPSIRTSLFRFPGLVAVQGSWVTNVHGRAARRATNADAVRAAEIVLTH
jgi:hypothetical protein